MLFASNKTLSQLNDAVDARFNTSHAHTKQIVGQTTRGKIATGLLNGLAPSIHRRTFQIEGDHSAADHLPTAMALILATAFEDFAD